MRPAQANRAALVPVKWLMIPLGIVAVMAGLITFWLPLPIGLPLILVGSTLLLRHSTVARRALAGASRRHPNLRSALRRLRRLRLRVSGWTTGRGGVRLPARPHND